MRHPRAKGNRKRADCISQLETEGWKVGIVERTGRFVKPKDLFGLFDLCCVKKPGLVLFAQVSCKNSQHEHGSLLEFARDHPFFQVRQYVAVNRNGFRIFDYNSMRWKHEDGSEASFKGEARNKVREERCQEHPEKGREEQRV